MGAAVLLHQSSTAAAHMLQYLRWERISRAKNLRMRRERRAAVLEICAKASSLELHLRLWMVFFIMVIVELAAYFRYEGKRSHHLCGGKRLFQPRRGHLAVGLRADSNQIA